MAEQRAAHNASLDAHRRTVLTAFQQVEDNLAALRVLENESDKVRETIQAAREAVTISEARYRAGAADYLNVITAQATLLGTQSMSVQLLARRAGGERRDPVARRRLEYVGVALARTDAVHSLGEWSVITMLVQRNRSFLLARGEWRRAAL